MPPSLVGERDMLKKIMVWGGIAFLVFFVAFKPSATGDAVKTLGQTLIDIGNGIGDFFNSIVTVVG